MIAPSGEVVLSATMTASSSRSTVSKSDGDIAAIERIGRKHPLEHAIQRHVMVARHGDQRQPRAADRERRGRRRIGLRLARCVKSPLATITSGPHCRRDAQQRFADRRATYGGPKCKIGNMQKRKHQASARAALSSCNMRPRRLPTTNFRRQARSAGGSIRFASRADQGPFEPRGSTIPASPIGR